jgi:small-conductance mechanosensitive channel
LPAANFLVSMKADFTEFARFLDQAPITVILLQVLLVWLVVLIAYKLSLALLRRLAAHAPIAQRLLDYGGEAARILVFLMAMQVFLHNDAAPPRLVAVLRDIDAIGTVAALTWLAVRSVSAVADTVIERQRAAVSIDSLHARRVQTQARVLAQTMTVLIVLIGAGLALRTLPRLEQIGTSLLASAGLAGLAVGIAARPVLANLLAGIQLALTQPIRLEDVVVVEGEWGWIEEITGTYVVVRLRDERRMIVPLQWFIEHPFQNWTRTSPEVFGAVMLKVDYRMPLAPLRAEVERLCKASPEWDGQMCQVQVVDAAAESMQLRVLAGTTDARQTESLCNKIREGLLDFMRRNYPDYPPR